MPKVVALNKGSKRRLRQIRWKLAEIVALVLLAILTFGVSLLVAIWEIHKVHRQSIPPPKVPQIKRPEPAEE